MGLKILKHLAALVVAAGLAAAPAKAALTGVTVVNPTFDLAGAGLTPSLLGDTGTTAEGFLSFPITGGDLGIGRIEHENSGVRLAGGGQFVDLENFIIDISDAANSLILADVTGPSGLLASDAPVFSFDLTASSDPFDLINPTLELLFTATASSVLNEIFGLGGENALTGVRFGFAATSPAEVPLPAAAWLFLAGAGLLGMAKRKKAASA